MISKDLSVTWPHLSRFLLAKSQNMYNADYDTTGASQQINRRIGARERDRNTCAATGFNGDLVTVFCYPGGLGIDMSFLSMLKQPCLDRSAPIIPISAWDGECIGTGHCDPTILRRCNITTSYELHLLVIQRFLLGLHFPLGIIIPMATVNDPLG